jgi:hypothetical protein
MKLLGDNEVEAVLQRLDRLSEDEARTTAAQTLEVVYRLVQNMKVFMDGEQIQLICHGQLLITTPARRQGIDGHCPGCSRCVLLVAISAIALSDRAPETMQQVASGMNRLTRRFFLTDAFANRKS